jgi:hypothetical protein
VDYNILWGLLLGPSNLNAAQVYAFIFGDFANTVNFGRFYGTLADNLCSYSLTHLPTYFSVKR